MSRDYCEACGYTDSHDPNCPRPRDDAQDDKPRTLAQRLAAEVNRNGDGMIPLTVALRVVEEAEGECCPEDYGLIEYVAVLKAQLQRAQSADVCSACGAKEGEPCRGNCERRMPSHVLRSETPVEWHEREKVAFEAWWQARADGYGKSYDVTAEPAVLAAGAAWFARAQQCTPSATERSGCPCTVEGIEPCSYACSCANPVMSGGCQRCALYGSLEQRQAAARRLIRSNRPADQTDGLAADFLRRTESTVRQK
jgi:hypothetical protein